MTGRGIGRGSRKVRTGDVFARSYAKADATVDINGLCPLGAAKLIKGVIEGCGREPG
jgi:hypothetical protein